MRLLKKTVCRYNLCLRICVKNKIIKKSSHLTRYFMTPFSSSHFLYEATPHSPYKTILVLHNYTLHPTHFISFSVQLLQLLPNRFVAQQWSRH